MPVHQHQQQAEEREKKQSKVKGSDIITSTQNSQGEEISADAYLPIGRYNKKNNQKSKGCGMDGEKAAEAFFRCVVSMSNLEVCIPYPQWALAALHSWKVALRD